MYFLAGLVLVIFKAWLQTIGKAKKKRRPEPIIARLFGWPVYMAVARLKVSWN